MSAFADTGPGEDGRRSAKQWMAAMAEDVGLAHMYLRQAAEPELQDCRALKLALALKEARRFQSDIYRYGKEVHGISREEIDRQGPL